MKRSTAKGLQRQTAAGAPGGPPSRVDGRRARGFTVIELMVTVTVVAILASIAVPALLNTVRDSSVTSASNQLVAALNYARSQALVQHATVRVCKSANATTSSSPTCDTSASGNGYEKGWLVYVDNDPGTNTAYDTGDTLLKKFTLDNNNSITINGPSSTVPNVSLRVGFTPMGMLSGGSTATTYLVVCDDRAWARSGQYARVIGLNPYGRITSGLGNKQTDIGTSATTCTPS